MSLVTLKCVEATFFSVKNRADGDDDPSGFGATFASASASASGDRIAANASAGAI